MNVINKIKSKRNKQQCSQIEKQEQAQQKQPNKTQQTQSIFKQKHSKLPSQIQPQLRQEQKSSSFREDIDQLNINQYYTRKDRKIKLMNRIQSGDTFKQQNLKSAAFCFNIKKSSTFGDICVFQGEIINQKHGKQVYRKKVKLSCSLDTIPFPQTISKILLEGVTMINNQQGLFIAEKIEKIIEKGNQRK